MLKLNSKLKITTFYFIVIYMTNIFLVSVHFFCEKYTVTFLYDTFSNNTECLGVNYSQNSLCSYTDLLTTLTLDNLSEWHLEMGIIYSNAFFHTLGRNYVLAKKYMSGSLDQLILNGSWNCICLVVAYKQK